MTSLPATAVRTLDVTEIARHIRSVLKAAFPHTRFQVTSARYSMGSSVDVHWIDGPPVAVVRRLTDRFHGVKTVDVTDYAEPADPFLLDGALVRSHSSVSVSRTYSLAFLEQCFLALANALGVTRGLLPPVIVRPGWAPCADESAMALVPAPIRARIGSLHARLREIAEEHPLDLQPLPAALASAGPAAAPRVAECAPRTTVGDVHEGAERPRPPDAAGLTRGLPTPRVYATPDAPLPP